MFACMHHLPISPASWANKMLKMNGNESSMVFVSELKRFKIRPTGVMSKKLNSVCSKLENELVVHRILSKKTLW